MLLPVRCFTCNRVLCDEKYKFFVENRNKEISEIIKFYDFKNNNIIQYPVELKEAYKNEKDIILVSPSVDFHLLNIIGVDRVCCRRMFLGTVEMIHKIN